MSKDNRGGGTNLNVIIMGRVDTETKKTTANY